MSACRSFPRVDKPIAGINQGGDLYWGGFSKGKPNNTSPKSTNSSSSIIDQILPNPQISPVTISGELFKY
jgi:hypothetical protein